MRESPVLLLTHLWKLSRSPATKCPYLGGALSGAAGFHSKTRGDIINKPWYLTMQSSGEQKPQKDISLNESFFVKEAHLDPFLFILKLNRALKSEVLSMTALQSEGSTGDISTILRSQGGLSRAIQLN